MIILIFIIIEILLISLFNTSEMSDAYAICAIAINSIVVFLYLFRKYPEYLLIIFSTYILRLVILFIDYYYTIDYLHGQDAENFHYFATEMYKNSTFKTYALTNYTYFVGAIYILFGPSRLFVQYFNILFFIGIVLYQIKSMNLFNISKKIKRRLIFVCAFFPSSLSLSVVLSRDPWIIFFISISIYYFLLWYRNKTKNNKCVVISVLAIFCSGIMHSGVLILIIGYIFAYSFYVKSKQKIIINIKGTFFFGSILFFIGLFVVSSPALQGKLTSIISDGDILQKINFVNDNGESNYLTWLNINSFSKLLFFSPIKMVYFQFSPLPIDFRGFADILAFIFDSLIYFYLIFNIFKYYKYSTEAIKNLVKLLLICYLCLLIIFSLGTSNTGTAIRHRYKLFPILLVTFAIVPRQNNRIKYKL